MLHGAGTGALSLSCIGAVGVNHRVTQLNREAREVILSQELKKLSSRKKGKEEIPGRNVSTCKGPVTGVCSAN